MDYPIGHNDEEKKDRIKSAVITFILSLILLLGIYFYQFTKIIPTTEEVVTTMLINFGDEQNGNRVEEPANQDGSTSASELQRSSPQQEMTVPQPTHITSSSEKIITGNNVTKTIVKTERSSKTSTKSTPSKTKSTGKTSGVTTKNSSKSSGDGRGNAAIGNLIRGRGQSTGSQGNNSTAGNAGDPLGGSGNGDSKIGVDRKLIGFIPGTMGRGGTQPSHNCTASGVIIIAYTVDKAGNVISARRSSGISDPCATTTTISWVKKYVKAERATTSSTGTYKISF